MEFFIQVIKKPMDLGTTRAKIEAKTYTNLMEYKADIKLICTNAMNYNHPDTIYYKVTHHPHPTVILPCINVCSLAQNWSTCC